MHVTGPRRGTPVLVALCAALAAFAQPPAPVRVVAEWEPAIGTLIRWPLGLPQAVVVELARDDTLFVLVRTQGEENDARGTFASWGIDLARVAFIYANAQTVWTRDWGPHQIFDGDGEWAIIDPIFQGYPWVLNPCAPVTSPGGHPGDDAANVAIAVSFGAPRYAPDVYLTGGNFLVDGHAAAFSTCAMIGENQQLWEPEAFLARCAQYLGIEVYHVLDNTEDYGIQHIDCWLKLLDEETLLVKRPPAWHEEYPRIEANLQTLAQATTCYGRPYRIIRIDCPAYSGNRIAAYTNSLILNRKVLVPLFNIPGDAEALQTYADAMPGYEVLGFPWSGWQYYDALHCRTRAIFDRYMLRMTHRRLDDLMPADDVFPVSVTIDDRSEMGLIPSALRLYWRLGGATEWNIVPLWAADDPESYGAEIPGQPPGSRVEYYLAAADNSGRSETLPRTAPAGWYHFTVEEPGLRIEVPDPPELVAHWTPTTFAVRIDERDEQLVEGSATLHFRYRGSTWLTLPLTELRDPRDFLATLPPCSCLDAPAFYIAARGTKSGLKTAPPGAPGQVYRAAVGELVDATWWAESFAAGLPAAWTATGLWHVTGSCGTGTPCEAAPWAYFGLDQGCDYDNGQRVSGRLAAPPIELPELAPGGRLDLFYCSLLETEGEPGYDIACFEINGVEIHTPPDDETWHTLAVDLSGYAGEAVALAWLFDSIDAWYNDYRGWLVDHVRIVMRAPACQFDPPYEPGDVDCSGQVDFDDIDPFVDALTGGTAYYAGHPLCSWYLADCNEDGHVDFDDIDAFVDLLSR